LFLANPAGASLPQIASLIDCKEFIDQAEAQRFFEVKGGPDRDPYYLDSDTDGIACEPGPEPTPVSDELAEYCEGFLDYMADQEGGVSETSRNTYERDCAAWIDQTGPPSSCLFAKGLSFRFFSSLTQDPVDDLTEMQREEYNDLMSLGEGECVPVDVARTSAWQCQPLSLYVDDYAEKMFGITDYYRSELAERYQVVCMGAPIKLGQPSRFSAPYLIGAALVGGGAVYLFSRSRKSQPVSET
jgi:hypothetical protein